jgi:amino-acid N-acetyltransferase
MKTRQAKPADAAAIHRLISHYAESGNLLPRTLEEVQSHVDHFFLLVEPAPKNADGSSSKSLAGDELLGCVALEPYGTDLVEIRSLAVAPECRGQGLGAKLLRAGLAFARRRKFARVFAVTAETNFFLRQGFTTTQRTAIAQKIERDCRVCPKERTCRLAAVVATIAPKRILLPVVAELTAQ